MSGGPFLSTPDNIADAWVSLLWLAAPVFALALAALVVRFGVVRRALRAFDPRGAGPWLDGRRAIFGVVERADEAASTGDDGSGWISVGRAFAQKRTASPSSSPRFTLECALRVRLEDGTDLEIPAGTPLECALMPAKSLRVDAPKPPVSSAKGYAHPVRLAAGSAVWLLARVEEPRTEGGPMRSSSRRSLADGAPVALSAAAPVAPECSFGGSYTLVWLALLGSGWMAAADGALYASMGCEALFGVLACVSLRNSQGYLRGLRQRGI